MDKLVMNYLLSKNVQRADTLFFGPEKGTASIVDDGELEDLVLKVIVATHKFSSVNSDDLKETRLCANRSSLDIWRHVKNFRPQTSLEEVMRTLVPLVRKKLIGTMYCSTIRRRVFKSSKLDSAWATDGMQTLSDGPDEYGLRWSRRWETVGLEEEEDHGAD